MRNIKIELQITVKNQQIPSQTDFEQWLAQAAKLLPPPYANNEICIRIINEQESQQLNETYRHKSAPTNILSFTYNDEETTVTDDDNIHLLGDLAICAPLVSKQAIAQNKPVMAHWAHLVIHGYLHLLGYDHKTSKKTTEMEQLEIAILQKLGYSNPYAVI
jgi:probable rRNA maturation factor